MNHLLWRPPSEERLKRVSNLVSQSRHNEAGWYLIQPDVVMALGSFEDRQRTAESRRRHAELVASMALHGVKISDKESILAYIMGAHHTYTLLARWQARGEHQVSMIAVLGARKAFVAICRQYELSIPEWVKQDAEPPKG